MIWSAPVAMDFSGVYRTYPKALGKETVILDMQKVEGTSCYLDPEAESKILKAIHPYRTSRIHLLDRGDYHYMTALWCRMLPPRDYCLLLLDNHPDTQEPRFQGIMSCGSWLRELIQKDRHLHHAYIIGADETLRSEARDLIEQGKVVFVSGTDILDLGIGAAAAMLEKEALPVYVSIDLDVLLRSVFRTNWDQGVLELHDVGLILDALQDREILGVDICGEETAQNQGCETSPNQRVIGWLLEKITGILNNEEKK